MPEAARLPPPHWGCSWSLGGGLFEGGCYWYFHQFYGEEEVEDVEETGGSKRGAPKSLSNSRKLSTKVVGEHFHLELLGDGTSISARYQLWNFPRKFKGKVLSSILYLNLKYKKRTIPCFTLKVVLSTTTLRFRTGAAFLEAFLLSSTASETEYK